jgi:hypothetical protein
MSTLKDIKTILFVDEIKFSKNDNDVDDSFYYIGVVVKEELLSGVRERFKNITARLQRAFHATRDYGKKSPNIQLMENLTNLILDFNLPCVVFKYEKERFYELTKKYLTKLDFEEKDRFKSHEFQAFFYFVQVLDFFLKTKLKKIEPPVRFYFDRGVYGYDGTQELKPYSEKIEIMTFCEKSLIDLIALPDHFGYIFRKCRIKYNADRNMRNLNALVPSLSNSNLLNNCILNLLAVVRKDLFIFLDIDLWIESIGKDTSVAHHIDSLQLPDSQTLKKLLF